MSTDITYCANEKCRYKKKCKRYKTEGYGKEFWFAVFNPEECGEVE